MVATKIEIGWRAKPTEISSAQLREKFVSTKRRSGVISQGCARRTEKPCSALLSNVGSFSRLTSKSAITLYLRIKHAHSHALRGIFNELLQATCACLLLL